MSREDFFRKELTTELRRVEAMMRRDESIEKKIYYFSAAYGITNRTLRYAFTQDYLMADFVLNTCYTGLMDRFKRIRSGDNTVPLEARHFEKIQDGLRMLADAFDEDISILKPLETILTATFATSGPGNYLREKGELRI
ncbi:hypothetical protein [Methanoculleus sp.]|uniref:hypothetical protein n=1 Tax=Methanoculleus sp. TaxID=90427 RepID=UPI002C48106B|nr:hypothetical protein [Methanoculleus sp.]HNT08483.1 hypothetical protein [Methanoculleus sp.]